MLIVRRRGGAGQVVNLIDLVFERLGHIVADQFEIGIAHEVGDVALPAGEKIVEADDFISLVEKSLAEMGPKKAGSAGDQNAHGREPSSIRQTWQGWIAAPSRIIVPSDLTRDERRTLFIFV